MNPMNIYRAIKYATQSKGKSVVTAWNLSTTKQRLKKGLADSRWTDTIVNEGPMLPRGLEKVAAVKRPRMGKVGRNIKDTIINKYDKTVQMKRGLTGGYDNVLGKRRLAPTAKSIGEFPAWLTGSGKGFGTMVGMGAAYGFADNFANGVDMERGVQGHQIGYGTYGGSSSAAKTIGRSGLIGSRLNTEGLVQSLHNNF
jgi:hypothetical protein